MMDTAILDMGQVFVGFAGLVCLWWFIHIAFFTIEGKVRVQIQSFRSGGLNTEVTKWAWSVTGKSGLTLEGEASWMWLARRQASKGSRLMRRIEDRKIRIREDLTEK